MEVRSWLSLSLSLSLSRFHRAFSRPLSRMRELGKFVWSLLDAREAIKNVRDDYPSPSTIIFAARWYVRIIKKLFHKNLKNGNIFMSRAREKGKREKELWDLKSFQVCRELNHLKPALPHPPSLFLKRLNDREGFLFPEPSLSSPTRVSRKNRRRVGDRWIILE